MNKKKTLEVLTFLHTFVSLMQGSGSLATVDAQNLHEQLYKLEDSIQNPPKKKTKKSSKKTKKD